MLDLVCTYKFSYKVRSSIKKVYLLASISLKILRLKGSFNFRALKSLFGNLSAILFAVQKQQTKFTKKACLLLAFLVKFC
jgi:hypothetical protein